LPRPDWSRPLPRPLVIPTVMTLKTLADVRVLVRHLPEDRRTQPAWPASPHSLSKQPRGVYGGKRRFGSILLKKSQVYSRCKSAKIPTTSSNWRLLTPQIDLELAQLSLRWMMRPPASESENRTRGAKKIGPSQYSDFFNRIGHSSFRTCFRHFRFTPNFGHIAASH